VLLSSSPLFANAGYGSSGNPNKKDDVSYQPSFIHFLLNIVIS